MNVELVEEKVMEIEEETEQPTAVKKSVSILDTRMAIRPFKTCPNLAKSDRFDIWPRSDKKYLEGAWFLRGRIEM